MNDIAINKLTALAIKINGFNDQVEFHKDSAIVSAAKCGAELNEAKELVKYGELDNWLANNCSRLKRANAFNYMKLAKEMPILLDDSKVHTSGLLGLSQAIALLSATEEVKTDVIEKIESGEKVTIAEINRMKKEVADKDDLLSKVRKQRDDWKGISDNQISKLTSKLNTVEEDKQKAINAAVILERQNMQLAIEAKKAEAEKMRIDMVALKKLHEKTVDEKVNAKLAQMQIEINQKQYQIDSSEKRINALKLQEREMEQTFGKISRHKKALAEIQNLIELMFIPYGGILEDQEWDVPNDIISDWNKIEKSLQSALNTTSGICEKLHQPALRVVSGDLV
jgi:hypothetical protein